MVELGCSSYSRDRIVPIVDHLDKLGDVRTNRVDEVDKCA